MVDVLCFAPFRVANLFLPSDASRCSPATELIGSIGYDSRLNVRRAFLVVGVQHELTTCDAKFSDVTDRLLRDASGRHLTATACFPGDPGAAVTAGVLNAWGEKIC